MADVLEVCWVLREQDRKLTHDGWKRVTRIPKPVLLVEVKDAKKGIQSDKFYAQCERMAAMMRRVSLKCVVATPQSEDLPSAS